MTFSATRRYFDLSDDMNFRGRWDLGHPLDREGRKLDNPWQFRVGEWARADGRVRIPVRGPGTPLDYSHASFSIPVVSARVASILTRLAPNDVQLIPVEVDGQRDEHFVLNATQVVRCIDDNASEEVHYWLPEDGRPEKVGTYRAVYGMRIDPAKVGDANIFRPWGWLVTLIVSEDIKEAMEREGITGTRFKEVTGPSAISPEERERTRRFRELWEQTHAARAEAWSALGKMEEETFVPIVVGGDWPSKRESWRVIHRPDEHTLLVSDGLSDPFYLRPEPSVGFGVELALETNEPLGNVEKSWPLYLLERVAAEVATHERVREQVKGGFMSMEVAGKGMPEPLLTKDGRVGVLLGMDAATLPGHLTVPSGQVRLVTVKALMPPELAYLLEHGKPGRDELIRRFHQEGPAHLSRSWRQPVL
ncbi:imm11 family protein [Pyxidicoccus sp. MSG2]|uniref:imm11 family protein n=1 Tax=Pyxidicoccus sp. MSG2 TaxID=2996790 RepID=UPI00226D4BFF|nr:DUF1629 domain-containing protein [Pyxidicoccus sp. MSG2]MCY1018720.1 suppressor of fused domain protein [Pyxidicoccus sp. MSG2]